MRVRSLLVPAVALALGLSLAPSAVADPPSPPGTKASQAGRDHRAEQAEAALATVEEILAGDASRRNRAHDHAHGRSLTLALRDLFATKDALSGDRRARAERILARPRATSRSCTRHICVHYTRIGRHAPSLRDRNRNRVPDYVDKVRTTVHAIHTRYKRAGYRSPLPDGRKGGDKRTDIYIRDIGDGGLYGFCTSDQRKKFSNQNGWNAWAYCVLDDDYSRREFRTNSPIENMRVTAAHEYFHAVQFAYDAFEDAWVMESTAAWVEDEMFDSVNDNRQYLRHSPMLKNHISLDFGDRSSQFYYGVWIFWRYLTDRWFRKSAAGLPTLVRDVWRRLDGSRRGPDDYSLQGLTRVLGTRGTNLATMYARFAEANRHPKTASGYEEGAAYRSAQPDQVTTLSAVSPSGSHTTSLDHLTSYTVRFVPGADLTASNWKLSLTFDLPPAVTGSAAMVTTYWRNGTITSSFAPLVNGDATDVRYDFDVTDVKYAEVTLVNASNRFTCWRRQPFSCQGVPLDDNQIASVEAQAVQVLD